MRKILNKTNIFIISFLILGLVITGFFMFNAKNIEMFVSDNKSSDNKCKSYLKQ